MGKEEGSKLEIGPEAPGSFERANAHLYPNIQPRSERQSSHVVSPSMSFKTGMPVDEAFVKMLTIMDQMDFN